VDTRPAGKEKLLIVRPAYRMLRQIIRIKVVVAIVETHLVEENLIGNIDQSD
jgi:hypothetical protein